MSVGISITIRGDAREVVGELLDRIGDQATFFAAASELMLDDVQSNFRDQSDPDGNPWAALAPATVERRGSASPILEVTGDLRKVTAQPEATRAVVSTLPLVYAAIHNEGGTAGRGRSVEILARPYLGFSERGTREIVELAEEMILAGL